MSFFQVAAEAETPSYDQKKKGGGFSRHGSFLFRISIGKDSNLENGVGASTTFWFEDVSAFGYI